MKKFMKGCAITALVLFILGVAMAFVAGTVRGGDIITEVVERVTNGRVRMNWHWFPYGVVINNDRWLGWGGNGWVYGLGDDSAYDSGYEVLRGKVLDGAIFPDSDEKVTDLDIELGGYVFETRTSSNGLTYLETSGVRSLQCYVKNGELRIRSLNNRVGGSNSAGKIILYIPEGQTYGKVDIELGVGELTVSDLDADKISLEVGAGTVLMDGVRAGKLEAEVGLGQLEIYGMDVDELDVEVGMGELIGHGSVNKRAALDCAMGNLELKLSGEQEDFNYRLDAAAGNVDIGTSSFSGLGMERRIDNGAAKDIEIDCSMGNVTVRFDG